MTAPKEGSVGGGEPKRRKGRPPRIDREKIVLAARSLPPERVTMQAVAEILGVDPTALNYHVGGRVGFLRLVALDRARLAAHAFAEEPESADWREALVRFAGAMRSSIASIGPLARYLEFDAASAVSYIAPLERILRSLTSAGLPLADALRALLLVSHTAAHAGKADAHRRAMAEGAECEAPHGSGSPKGRDGDAEGALRGHGRFFDMLAAAPDDFPLIRSLMRGEVEGIAFGEASDADDQFAFELDTVLDGIAARLPGPGAH